MYRRYLCDFELNRESEVFDVIVVGAGASGLFAALNLPEHLKVLVLTKGSLDACNSYLAQGGIAITLDEDYQSHIEDTLEAGSYSNRPEVVEALIKGSVPAYSKLEGCQIDFDRDAEGNLLFTGEGGHTKRRIIHHKDISGEAVMAGLERQIAERDNICVREFVTVVDVITVDHRVQGVVVMDETVKAIRSKVVLLATGGIGGLFENTTNAATVTGDGMAMALRAGASIEDAEFIQFHPTAMAMHSGGYFLISEAVRGEGGYLINDLGQRFMLGKHKMNELAPRDVVSKAINEEVQRGRKVFVDVRHFEEGYFVDRFPKIYSKCLENGFDPTKELIPITPVEHYYMGGVACGIDGKTNIEGLYVTGEASCSGFHGANRLASNSLLECLVLSLYAAEDMHRYWEALGDQEHLCIGHKSQGMRAYGAEKQTKQGLDWAQMKSMVSQNLTIVRHRQQLQATITTIDQELEALSVGPATTLEEISVYNGLCVLKAICEASIARAESLGSFLIEE